MVDDTGYAVKVSASRLLDGAHPAYEAAVEDLAGRGTDVELHLGCGGRVDEAFGYVEQEGIRVVGVHSSDNELASDVPTLSSYLDTVSAFDAGYVGIHPPEDGTALEPLAERLEQAREEVHRFGGIVLVENIPDSPLETVEDIREFTGYINDRDGLGLNVDILHTESPVEMLEIGNGSVGNVHVHDGIGVDAAAYEEARDTVHVERNGQVYVREDGGAYETDIRYGRSTAPVDGGWMNAVPDRHGVLGHLPPGEGDMLDGEVWTALREFHDRGGRLTVEPAHGNIVRTVDRFPTGQSFRKEMERSGR